MGESPPEKTHSGTQQLGDFVLLRRIGEGSMGAVFKAQQKSLNRIVAVKVLSPKLAKDSEHVERFMREARACAVLDHPNIVQGITFGEDKGLHYFVMEFLEGVTVQQRFKREGPFPVLDVLEIGHQCALGLSHAHRRNMLHRDIKPENLMLIGGHSGLFIKVMDLGLARTSNEDASLTQAGTTLGTPLYISPEQARGVQELTPACDLYSLGATLFHLVCGEPPFKGATSAAIMSQHIVDPPPDPKKLRPEIPDAFCEILARLLAKKPEDRYGSAAQLASDLQNLRLKIAANANTASNAPVAFAGEKPGRSDGPEPGKTNRDAQIGEHGAPAESEEEDAAGRKRPGVRRAYRFRRRSRSNEFAALSTIFILGFVAIACAAGYHYFIQVSVGGNSDGTPAQPIADEQRLTKLYNAALAFESASPEDNDGKRRAWNAVLAASAGGHYSDFAAMKLEEITRRAAAEAKANAQADSDKARQAAPNADRKTPASVSEIASGKWQDKDIGSPELNGSFSIANGVVTVQACGSIMWDVRDRFHFVYQALKGDGEIVARVLSLDSPHPHSKAGVMMRDSIHSDAKYAAMVLTASSGVGFQYRPDLHVPVRMKVPGPNWTGTPAKAPHWVKLVRTHNLFTAYRSTDGNTWIEESSAEIQMGETIFIGLAACPHEPRHLFSFMFDNVSLSALGKTR